jgi:hypothetical protein
MTRMEDIRIPETIPFWNSRGVIREDKSAPIYKDPQSGAHFEYKAMCQILRRLHHQQHQLEALELMPEPAKPPENDDETANHAVNKEERSILETSPPTTYQDLVKNGVTLLYQNRGLLITQLHKIDHTRHAPPRPPAETELARRQVPEVKVEMSVRPDKKDIFTVPEEDNNNPGPEQKHEQEQEEKEVPATVQFVQVQQPQIVSKPKIFLGQELSDFLRKGMRQPATRTKNVFSQGTRTKDSDRQPQIALKATIINYQPPPNPLEGHDRAQSTGRNVRHHKAQRAATCKRLMHPDYS